MPAAWYRHRCALMRTHGGTTINRHTPYARIDARGVIHSATRSDSAPLDSPTHFARTLTTIRDERIPDALPTVALVPYRPDHDPDAEAYRDQIAAQARRWTDPEERILRDAAPQMQAAARDLARTIEQRLRRMLWTVPTFGA